MRSLLVFSITIAASACVTGTAHQLPLVGNPMREQATACATACRKARPPARVSCPDGPCDEASPSSASFDEGEYARCLDQCPGARAIDGEDCRDPPNEGVICVKTYRANAGGIAAGTLAAASGATLLVVGATLATLPGWLILLAILVH